MTRMPTPAARFERLATMAGIMTTIGWGVLIGGTFVGLFVSFQTEVEERVNLFGRTEHVKVYPYIGAGLGIVGASIVWAALLIFLAAWACAWMDAFRHQIEPEQGVRPES